MSFTVTPADAKQIAALLKKLEAWERIAASISKPKQSGEVVLNCDYGTISICVDSHLTNDRPNRNAVERCDTALQLIAAKHVDAFVKEAIEIIKQHMTVPTEQVVPHGGQHGRSRQGISRPVPQSRSHVRSAAAS